MKQHKSGDIRDFVKSTKQGRLYYETNDFFKIQKVKDTIKKLLNSKTIKDINSKINLDK